MKKGKKIMSYKLFELSTLNCLQAASIMLLPKSILVFWEETPASGAFSCCLSG